MFFFYLKHLCTRNQPQPLRENVRRPRNYGPHRLKSSVNGCNKNTPLPSSKNAYFQNKAKCTTFLVKMSFILHENEKLFPSQRLSTLPRFDTNRKILFRLQNMVIDSAVIACRRYGILIFSNYWIRLSTI